jgi:hypothetical protein
MVMQSRMGALVLHQYHTLRGTHQASQEDVNSVERSRGNEETSGPPGV